MNVKPYIIIFLIAILAVVHFLSDIQAQQPFGSLQRQSLVYTSDDELITKDGFPVFEVRVPEGYLEVQVRATVTNFEPGFLLKEGDDFIFNYIPTGDVVNGKKVYRALSTTHIASFNSAESCWEFTYNGLTANSVEDDPWDIDPADFSATGYSTHKEYFVYRFCTTGEPADPLWGEGTGDPDAFVYIANQTATPGDNTEFKRVAWNSSSALADQLQAAGTPGYTVMFQPSRDVLGTDEWMQQNASKLIWIYQVEDVSGKPQHPNGSDVWNIMYPSEWRKTRLLIE